MQVPFGKKYFSQYDFLEMRTYLEAFLANRFLIFIHVNIGLFGTHWHSKDALYQEKGWGGGKYPIINYTLPP